MPLQREEKSFKAMKKDETNQKSLILDEEMKNRQFKQLTIFNQQQEDIEVGCSIQTCYHFFDFRIA